jgi:LmbE family N-acetylglucosaminyl deacetylase
LPDREREFFMGAWLRWFYRHLMNNAMREWPPYEFARRAIVFAPHPDDEALGCGGTVIRKKQAGADVKIVFMTDGSESHAHLMPASALRAIRAAEAVAAAKALGVEQTDVILLDFKDGRLADYRDIGVRRVTEILRRQRPAQIFVPYAKDGPPDHEATTDVVVAALRARGQPATIYEYPVWFWHHWPWTRLKASGGGLLEDVKRGVVAGWRLLKDFRSCVPIGEVLGLKRAALARHQSQVTRLTADSSWTTLGDVAGGDFIQCFFQEREIFHRHRLGHN